MGEKFDRIASANFCPQIYTDLHRVLRSFFHHLTEHGSAHDIKNLVKRPPIIFQD
jgi:hypothetical protein